MYRFFCYYVEINVRKEGVEKVSEGQNNRSKMHTRETDLERKKRWREKTRSKNSEEAIATTDNERQYRCREVKSIVWNK